MRTPEGNGYFKVRRGDKQVREHVAVAEAVIGKRLPAGALVHHADLNRSNNAPGNLVICPNDAYHLLLHQRIRAMDACGNPNWLKCWICKTYAPADQVVVTGANTYHRKCDRAYQAARRARIRESA